MPQNRFAAWAIFSPRLLPLLHGTRDDHFAEGGVPVGIEEHMLGAAQADALRAEAVRILRVPWACRRLF
jgi:hypothetical protein